jgi:hypothetical protein
MDRSGELKGVDKAGNEYWYNGDAVPGYSIIASSSMTTASVGSLTQ